MSQGLSHPIKELKQVDVLNPSTRTMLKVPAAQDEVSRLMDFNEPAIGPKGKIVITEPSTGMTFVIKRVEPK